MLRNRSLYIEHEEAKRYKVITNGVKTEAGYFIRLNEISKDVIEIETKKGFSLDDMLETAKNIREKSEGNYDEICIVLDIDDQMENKAEKENLIKFLEKAKEECIPVYLSNESFEIWLLAHEIQVPKIAARHEIATELAIQRGLLDNERRKQVVEEKINAASILHALKESERLRKMYGSNIIKNKPTTEVDNLVKKIKIKEK